MGKHLNAARLADILSGANDAMTPIFSNIDCSA